MPTPQGVHAVLPAPAVHDPASHAGHSATPDDADAVPGPHSSHVPAETLAYEPGAQSRHKPGAVAPATGPDPGGHV